MELLGRESFWLLLLLFWSYTTNRLDPLAQPDPYILCVRVCLPYKY
jgi:hypothetical protein